MQRSKDFIDMVNNDIKKCEEYFESKKNEMQLFQELYGRYSKASNNFPPVENNQLGFKLNPRMAGNNIRAIYGFLVAFRNSKYDDYHMNTEKNAEKPNILITNTNSTETNINFNLTF